MNHQGTAATEVPRWIVLVLRPASDAPPDMPPGEVSVEAALHPRSSLTEPDDRWQVGFPSSAYRKVAEPASYDVPLGMTSLHQWFQRVLAPPDYAITSIDGRSQKGEETVYWTVLNVRPATMPDVIIQATLRYVDDSRTAVTYRAEQHPVPDRDPASYLAPTCRQVDVEYTFMNGPHPTVRRVVTDPTDVRRLVERINGCPRDIRRVALGRMMDRWANLRFATKERSVMPVYVDPAHDIIRVGDFPALSGTIWSLLTEIAPPD